MSRFDELEKMLDSCHATIADLERQLAQRTQERDTEHRGQLDAVAVILSLEGMAERLTQERDAAEAKMEQAEQEAEKWREMAMRAGEDNASMRRVRDDIEAKLGRIRVDAFEWRRVEDDDVLCRRFDAEFGKDGW